jgi:hypothetical protein
MFAGRGGTRFKLNTVGPQFAAMLRRSSRGA